MLCYAWKGKSFLYDTKIDLNEGKFLPNAFCMPIKRLRIWKYSRHENLSAFNRQLRQQQKLISTSTQRCFKFSFLVRSKCTENESNFPNSTLRRNEKKISFTTRKSALMRENSYPRHSEMSFSFRYRVHSFTLGGLLLLLQSEEHDRSQSMMMMIASFFRWGGFFASFPFLGQPTCTRWWWWWVTMVGRWWHTHTNYTALNFLPRRRSIFNLFDADNRTFVLCTKSSPRVTNNFLGRFFTLFKRGFSAICLVLRASFKSCREWNENFFLFVGRWNIDESGTPPLHNFQKVNEVSESCQWNVEGRRRQAKSAPTDTKAHVRTDYNINSVCKESFEGGSAPQSVLTHSQCLHLQYIYSTVSQSIMSV